MGQTGRIASADRVEMVPSGHHARSCGTDADRHVAHPRPEIRGHAAIEKHGTPHRLLCASVQRRPKGRFATSGRPVEGVRSWHGRREARGGHGDGFRHERQAAQAQPAVVRPDRGHADRGAQGRRIIVVDDTEPDDDLVRDMAEVLTSFCARLYGRRAAKRKTDAALRAARDA